jgi:hypothetical protein
MWRNRAGGTLKRDATFAGQEQKSTLTIFGRCLSGFLSAKAQCFARSNGLRTHRPGGQSRNLAFDDLYDRGTVFLDLYRENGAYGRDPTGGCRDAKRLPSWLRHERRNDPPPTELEHSLLRIELATRDDRARPFARQDAGDHFSARRLRRGF